MMKIFVTKQQWKQWSLPSKFSYFGTWLSIVGLLITIIVLGLDLHQYLTRNLYYQKPLDFSITTDTIHLHFESKETDKDVISNFPNARNLIDVMYPKISVPNNTFIQGEVNKVVRNLIESYQVNLDNPNLSKPYGEVRIHYKKMYQLNNLVGFQFFVYVYGTGAAHGNDEVISLNIDLQNGKRFSFGELFTKSGLRKVEDLMSEALEKHDCFCVNRKMKLNNAPKEFSFEENYLLITFPKYFAACGACGSVTIKIGLEKIIKHINKNGPLVYLRGAN